MSTAQRLAKEAATIMDSAERSGRALTADERVYLGDLLKRAEDQHVAEKAYRTTLRRLGGDNTAMTTAGDASFNATATDPGARFVHSDGFKSIADGPSRPQTWSTGMIEVSDAPPWQLKGTLLEGSGSPGSGTGGGLIPTSQVVPGVVAKLFQPLVLEQLLGSNTATGNTVRVIVQGTATSAATGVAEGGTKPESTLGLSTVDEPVKKIATTLTISDEMLDDVPSVQSFVSGQLGQFVNIEVEAELLRGTGSDQVTGLFNRSIPIYARGTVDSDAVALFKAMNGVRGSAFVEPEWIVMHPTDWQTIRLAVDTAGQFYGGGPFLGAYAGAAQVTASGQLTGAQDTLWGKRVYVTSAIGGAGTALVGSSAAATVWSRGGLRIEMTNSHSTYFQNDLVMMRAERRLALSVFRTAAFCEVRF